MSTTKIQRVQMAEATRLVDEAREALDVLRRHAWATSNVEVMEFVLKAGEGLERDASMVIEAAEIRLAD